MSQESAGPNLITDDFQWAAPEPEAQEQAAQDGGKSTELDRIEFEDPLQTEEFPSQPMQREESRPAEPVKSKREWKLPLFLTPKLMILVGTGLGIVVVVCGVLVHFLLGTPAPSHSGVITASIGTYEERNAVTSERRVLQDFLLPREEKKGTFTSYVVMVEVNKTFFDFYLSQEGLVRAEIFETLKEVEHKKLGEDFPKVVTDRVNGLLKAKVLVSAEIESNEKI